jgi:hypothetical protein
MRWIALAFAVALLTALTEVGGTVLLTAVLVGKFLRLRAPANTALFFVLYTVATLFIVPPLAAIGGRVPISCFGEPLRALPLYCALNRNYVTPELAAMAEALAADVAAANPGATTIALDANFPFFDGMPLLPHLSHDDGRKLDLAFSYATPDGGYLPGVTRSVIGYWAFEQPQPDEEADCPASWPTARWDFAWLQPLWPDLPLDPERTRATLDWLFTKGRGHGLERVFLEPYLAKRLSVASPLLGFQGCRAARHDDHVHIQIAE